MPFSNAAVTTNAWWMIGGIEPPHPFGLDALARRCTTIHSWCRREDLNHEPSTYKAGDAWMDRIEAVDISKVVKNLYMKWAPHEILIEDAASGTIVIQELRRANFPISAFNPRKMPRGRNSKEERTQLAALMIGGAPIFYPEQSAAIQAVIQSACEFPRGERDDDTDCLVQAILYLRDRNQFDSAWELWADEIDVLRDEIEPEEESTRPANWKRSLYGHMPGSGGGPDENRRPHTYTGMASYTGNTADKATRMRQARRRSQAKMDRDRINLLDIGLTIDDIAPDELEDPNGSD